MYIDVQPADRWHTHVSDTERKIIFLDILQYPFYDVLVNELFFSHIFSVFIRLSFFNSNNGKGHIIRNDGSRYFGVCFLLQRTPAEEREISFQLKVNRKAIL